MSVDDGGEYADETMTSMTLETATTTSSAAQRATQIGERAQLGQQARIGQHAQLGEQAQSGEHTRTRFARGSLAQIRLDDPRDTLVDASPHAEFGTAADETTSAAATSAAATSALDSADFADDDVDDSDDDLDDDEIADDGDGDDGDVSAGSAHAGAGAASGRDAVALTASAGEALPPTSRKVRRRTKRDRPRSKTFAMKRVTRAELAMGALLYPPVDDVERPRTRAECREEARPCPWVACKHHLYLDINPETGSIKINFPDLEPWEMQHTCSLDVAEAGALTLEEIGLITNLTRERIRQVEVRGLLKLKSRREIR